MLLSCKNSVHQRLRIRFICYITPHPNPRLSKHQKENKKKRTKKKTKKKHQQQQTSKKKKKKDKKKKKKKKKKKQLMNVDIKVFS